MDLLGGMDLGQMFDEIFTKRSVMIRARTTIACDRSTKHYLAFSSNSKGIR